LTLNEKQKNIILSLAQGNSNSTIVENCQIPIKSVERILNSLVKKLKIDSKIFNPRLRLLMLLINKNIIEYQSNNPLRNIDNLDAKSLNTLSLMCTGFSNKSIARLLEISDKTVELRLANLFDVFSIDTKDNKEKNSRVELFISAFLRGLFSSNKLKRLAKETSEINLENIFNDPKDFIANLNNDHKFIG
jgi:DNA-binding NarL/FixJ family response regulator